MAVLIYGVKFRCDGCGVEEGIPDQYPVAAISYNQMPVPEGWVNLRLLNLQLTDPMGGPFTHLCGICGSLSVRGLVDRLNIRSQQH